MRKLIIGSTALFFWLLTAAPTWAQRVHVGGGAAASTRMSGMAQTHATITAPRATIPTDSRAAVRANAKVTTRGLERAETTQSLNTKADANRGSTVASGVEKAETRQAARANVQTQTNASATARAGNVGAAASTSGGARSRTDMTITPGSADAKTHASLGSRVFTKLHLKKKQ